MKRIVKSLLLVATLVLTYSANSQIVIDNSQTPEELVQNVLLGAGVTVSNVTFNGTFANATAIQTNAGEFSGTSVVGLPSGLILSSGNITEAVGPNASTNSGNNDGVQDFTTDMELEALAGIGIHDAAVLEFDFVPSGDTISFQYAFASEEYPEFAPPNGGINDAFGFFLTGNNPGGGTYNSQNLAVLPDGITEVNINNINPVTNQTFYQDNTGGADLEYDGLTTVLEVKAAVNCGETYHIKLGICDASDRAWNSAVFIEANSFSSSAVQVSVATVTGDTTLIEGCGQAEIVFTRPENDTILADTISFAISGDAINGDDYVEIDTFVIFPAGEDTIVLALDPIADGIDEPSESVTITAFTINSCGDTIETSGTVYIIDEPDMEIAVMDTVISCPNDSIWNGAVASGGHEPYAYNWSNGVPEDSAYFDGTQEGVTTYYVTATDNCGFTHTDSFTVTLNPAFFIDTIFVVNSECVVPPNQGTGSVSTLMSPPTNDYSYNWANADGSDDINASVWSNLNPGWYYFTVSFEGCTLTDSAQVGMDNPPVADYVASPEAGVAPLEVTFVNQSTNASTFEWNTYLDTFNVAGMGGQQEVYTEAGSYVTSLIAYSDNGCSDTAYVTINVIEFNPVTFEQPNVFTPNGDGVNELFDLNIENAENYEVQIRNRWGNVISTLTPGSPTWDGKTKSGADCPEGTYFYYYVITPEDLTKEEITGQGFVVLKKQ